MSKIDRLKRKISLSQGKACNLSNAGLFDADLKELISDLNQKPPRYLELSDNNLSDRCINDLVMLTPGLELIIDSNNFTFNGIQRLILSGNFSKLSFLRNGLTDEKMLQLENLLTTRSVGTKQHFFKPADSHIEKEKVTIVTSSATEEKKEIKFIAA